MKTLLLKTIVALTFCSSCYSQDYSNDSISDQFCLLPSRNVIMLAMGIWTGNYDTIISQGGLKTSRSALNVPGIYFEQKTLRQLRDCSEQCNNIMTMRFYLDSDTVKLALGNLGDTTKYLIKKNGVSQIVSACKEKLKEKFQAWEDTLKAPESPFVYVKEYYYCWSKVFQCRVDYVYFTFTAHSVSPSDHRYQSKNEDQEGYFAVDIALSLGDQGTFYDFAAPCPKNCYNFDTKSMELKP